jgi:hypothetical protein
MPRAGSPCAACYGRAEHIDAEVTQAGIGDQRRHRLAWPRPFGNPQCRDDIRSGRGACKDRLVTCQTPGQIVPCRDHSGYVPRHRRDTSDWRDDHREEILAMADRDAWRRRGAATRNIPLAGSFTLTHLATWPEVASD